MKQGPAGALQLSWTTADGEPFPMPVEVQIGDTITRTAVPPGGTWIPVAPNQHVVIDPWSRILRRNVAVEEAQAWRAAHTARR